MTESLEKSPINIEMTDLINAIFHNPLDAVAKALDDEEEVQRQIRPATPEELAAIEALAQKTALLQDELKALIATHIGTKSKELSVLKDQLLESMLNHNLSEVWVKGRPPIEVVVKKERKASKKSIIAALSKINGDPKKGTEEGNKLWNTIPQVDKETLSIPDPSPPEIDSPY